MMNAANHGPESGGTPGSDRWLNPEMVRQNQLRAQEAIERAREICEAARLLQAKARAQRERGRGLRAPEAALPPWEYTLPPLEAAVAYLDRDLPLLPEGPAEFERR